MTPPGSSGQRSSFSGGEGLEEHELEGVNPRSGRVWCPPWAVASQQWGTSGGRAGRSDRLILTVPLSSPWGCIVDGKKSCATQEGCPIAMGSYHLSWLVPAFFFFPRGCVTIVSLQAEAGIRAIGGQAPPSVITGLSGCPTSLVWS